MKISSLCYEGADIDLWVNELLSAFYNCAALSCQIWSHEIVCSGLLGTNFYKCGLIAHPIFSLYFNLHRLLIYFIFNVLPYLLFWFSHHLFFNPFLFYFLYQVSADFIKSGDFTLERMGVTYKAKAHLKTPFDPENKRIKGIYAWEGPHSVWERCNCFRTWSTVNRQFESENSDWCLSW